MNKITNHYEELPMLRVLFNENGKKRGTGEIFEKCEYAISGEFLIIYQAILKTVIPLIEIDTFYYPYPTNISPIKQIN